MSEKIILKSPAQIAKMREAGRIVAQVLAKLGTMVAPSITTKELDTAVEELIIQAGGIPLFKDYPSHNPRFAPFPASICASVNEQVVHGIPSERELREGDIISIDVGVELDGWCGDAARTYPVGQVGRKVKRLLEVTESSLMRAIDNAKVGKKLRDISAAVQKEVESNGMSVVKQFVGHGIGRNMHEAPQIPNYVCGPNERLDGYFPDCDLKAGMVLAIEPMVNLGGSDVLVDRKDGWTVYTKDRTWSAHFEHSVALTDEGPMILTEL